MEVLITEGHANVHQERKLGLVSPVVLASALGYDRIVEILLANGARANTRINNDQTALHVAALEGNNKVISVLLSKGRADINHADNNGNTAILFAAKAGNVATMRVLISGGSLIDGKNKMGQNIWDFAMLQSDNTFLKAVAELYKKVKRFNTADRKLVFPIGRTPLHVATSTGDIGKIRCLFELGADPCSKDLNGNTYYHIAAKENRCDVLKEFLGEVELDGINGDGDTALHLAAKYGHLQAVQILLQKSKLDARNRTGMTPLHEAVGSDNSDPEIISIMVDVIVKANNWSLVDAKDSRDNTALHVAARRGRPEILLELSALNPKIVNIDGDNPLHIAAKIGEPYTLDTMLDVFNKPEKGLNIDQKNADGDSLLHICARRGDVHRVDMLITCGADLAHQNELGNTVLHSVVEEFVLEPARKEALIEVFRNITHNSVKWWYMKNDLQQPCEESELYYSHLRNAMVHLTSKVYNNEGLNVVAYATVNGVVDLLDELLNTPNVYRFRKTGDFIYDITNLTPQTISIPHKFRKDSVRSKKSSVGILDDPPPKYEEQQDENVAAPETKSCLDLIVSMEDEVLATKILDINPMKQLVGNYWTA